MTMRRTTCPQCRKRLADGERIHPECVSAWADTRAAKAERAQAKAIKTAAKEDRAETKRRKEKLKTRSDWMRDAQKSVNAYVRKRDEGLPCISCGRFHKGEIHAGHYLSRGAHPELALDERNLAAQCQPCNVHLSGNQINYRKGLIARNGLAHVEWLEGPHEPKKYSEEELKMIAREYRIKLKQLSG